MNPDHDTVARELTPRGSGGVSVLELRGLSALRSVCDIVDVDALGLGQPKLVRVVLGGEILDEALVWAESEQRVELQLHGSAPLVRRLLEHFGSARPSLSTHEERAAELSAHAACETGARILLDQAEGAFSRALEAWAQLGRDAQLEAVETALARSRVARRALEPARVVLAGPVNAGKSTLFNALYGRERAIVSSRAGTTRDLVIERVQLGIWPVELCDTAGEGVTGAVAELELRGRKLAQTERARADLVVWLTPRDAPAPEPQIEVRTCVIESRCDLGPRGSATHPRISAQVDPQAAVETLRTEFERALGLPREFWRAGEALTFDDESRAALERRRSELGGREQRPAR